MQEWVEENRRLGRIQQSLEKGGSMVRDDDFNGLYRELGKSRQTEVESAHKRILNFRTGLDNIEDRLKDARGPGAGRTQYNPADLQRYLEAFESKLSAYKKSMRAEFDALQNNEKVLEVDVDNMLSKIETWEDNDEDANKTNYAKREAEKEKEKVQKTRLADRYEKHVQLQGNIGAIDRQLANLGGRYGGWDSRDNDVFMRVWVQTIPSDAGNSEPPRQVSDTQRALLMKRLIASVPTKTEEEMDAHIDWHIRYTTLVGEKKRHLEQWKVSRKKTQVQSAAYAVRGVLFGEGDSDLNTSTGSNDSGGGGHINTEDREALRVRIASWKKEKEDERIRKEATEKDQGLLKQQQLEHQKRQRQQQQRMKIENWRKEEEDYKSKVKKSEQIQMSVKDKERRSVFSAEEMAERQARDRELTQMHLAKREAAQDKKNARAIRSKELSEANLGVVGNNVKADPARLHTRTKAFQAGAIDGADLVEMANRRASTKAHDGVMPMSGRDLQMGGRGKVSWMK